MQTHSARPCISTSEAVRPRICGNGVGFDSWSSRAIALTGLQATMRCDATRCKARGFVGPSEHEMALEAPLWLALFAGPCLVEEPAGAGGDARDARDRGVAGEDVFGHWAPGRPARAGCAAWFSGNGCLCTCRRSEPCTAGSRRPRHRASSSSTSSAILWPRTQATGVRMAWP